MVTNFLEHAHQAAKGSSLEGATSCQPPMAQAGEPNLTAIGATDQQVIKALAALQAQCAGAIIVQTMLLQP
jgi:hypothetical protein